jgi:tryptophanyl-tRNA synthetase
MTRKFARRFNTMYGVDYFPEPDAYNFGEQLIKIPGLDGTGKMGKSEGNGVFLSDSPAEIRKKVMRAVTDEGPTGSDQEPSEPVKNLFTIMKVVSDPSTVNYFMEKHASCEIRYGDMKKQLAEDIIKVTDPIRERINDLLSDSQYLAKVVKEGSLKARESASVTLREVRKIIGYRSF